MLLGALPEDVLLQVATKLTAKEVWDSLKVRFVGADRVRAARLATLRGDFDRLKMAAGEALDAYAGRLAGMTTQFASLGETLGDAVLVKKLLDTVPDRLFPIVAGIEQFCDTATMAFDEALGRLRAFDERVRRRGQDDGERGGQQLLMTAAKWAARGVDMVVLGMTTMARAWRRAAAGTAVDAATSAACAATSRGTAPSCGGSRRRNARCWRTSSESRTTGSSEPWLRRKRLFVQPVAFVRQVYLVVHCLIPPSFLSFERERERQQGQGLNPNRIVAGHLRTDIASLIS
ncbi:retrotransposon protein [Hordeum vulgare]|nr:retrotransposon protein [Hordeum vulgare]